MLVIRKEQMQMLSELRTDCFVNRAVKHLQSNFPDKIRGMDESSLNNMIRKVMSKAYQYHIKTEDNIIRYLEFVMAYGSDFDTIPKAREALCSEDIYETAKMDLLDDRKSELSGTVRESKKTNNVIYENDFESIAPEAVSKSNITATIPPDKKQFHFWGIKNVKEVGSIVQGCYSDESEKKVNYTVKIKIVKAKQGPIKGVKLDLKPFDEKNYHLYSFYVNHPDEVKELQHQTDDNGEWKKDSDDGTYTIEIEKVINVKLQNQTNQTEENRKCKFEFLEPDTIKENEKSEILSYDSINVFHYKDEHDKDIIVVCLRFIELKCIVDSHMHVMSGHCGTVPMIDKLAYDNSVEIIRKKQGGLGLSQAVADLGIGKKCTSDIARKALEENREIYKKFKEKFDYENYELFTPMVVLPMDMEYAHIKGYEGMTIYRQCIDQDKKYNKKDLKNLNIYNDELFQNYYGEDTKAQVLFCDFKKKTRELKDKAKQSIEQGESPNRGFEPWQKQLEQTIQVVKENPWKLIPFFHYEPRRWLMDKQWKKKKEGLWHKEPFEEVATQKQSGLFVGFKMYTSLGYKPLDKNLNKISDFYEKCAKQQIPIMTHCTPGGNYSYEREDYLKYKKNNEGKEYKKKVDIREENIKKLNQEIRKIFNDEEKIVQLENEIVQLENEIQTIKIEYFNDKFVSPSVWEKVLKEYPNLKLCLAHFGDNPEEGGINELWPKIISDLCVTYPNFYTDISYVFRKKKDQKFVKKALLSKAEDKKRIFYKVMFGTDWYVMEKMGFSLFGFPNDYKRYCFKSKKFLDEVTKEFQEKEILTKEEDLWTIFTLINPFKYLGFVHVVDGKVKMNTELIKNIASALGNESFESKKNTKIITGTAQWVADYLNSDEERQELVTWEYEGYIDSPVEFPKEYEEINPKIKFDDYLA